MDHFRTCLPPFRPGMAIAHHHHVLSVGSCFAEQMGSRLQQLKFPVCLNPFGIVHNPVSVAGTLGKLLSSDEYAPHDLFDNLGLWHSFDHHSQFSLPDKELALRQINQSLQSDRCFLGKTDRLLLTLGTAHVFLHKESGSVVANCHKVPAKAFERRRLSVAEVAAPLVSVLQKMKEKLPALEVVATVSPVRHLRDGLVENQRSKATLLLGLEEVCRQLSFVHYFPAYELLLDDLRDYRFYANDLSHPSELATDYIWQYFETAFFEENTKALCQRIAALQTALAHRPFHPASTAHQAFLKNQLLEMAQLERDFPGLDFTKEKNVVEGQLNV